MKTVARSGLVAALALAGSCVCAQAPADFGAERERIARESAAVEARFADRQSACQSRFAVTDCVNGAKKERREALAPLRRQASALDDVQRKQRAAERVEVVRSKVGSAQAREREVVVRGAPGAARESTASAPAEPASAPVREVKPRQAPKRVKARPLPPVKLDAARRADEAAGQARIDLRKQEAQAHREAAERRNAERAASGKRAAPLPTPASGAPP